MALVPHTFSLQRRRIVEPAVAFGRTIRKRRLDAPTTQEKLVLDAGLERVFVSWLATGRRQPTFGTMLNLATALDCSATDLVYDAETLLKAASSDFSEPNADD
jgi:transcriptional regulator with XRE-family HTH domain